MTVLGGEPMRLKPRAERTVAVAKIESGYLLVIGDLTASEALNLSGHWHVVWPDVPLLVIRGDHLVTVGTEEVPPDVLAWLEKVLP